MSKNKTIIPDSGFREIKHTADIGIEVYGMSISKLFSNAIWGMNFLIIEDERTSTSFNNEIHLKELSLEDLLVSFLSEYNYRLQSKGKLIKKIIRLDINSIKDYYVLDFEGEFGQICPENRNGINEIKSVTYHQMNIEFVDNIYRTKIIFDT